VGSVKRQKIFKAGICVGQTKRKTRGIPHAEVLRLRLAVRQALRKESEQRTLTDTSRSEPSHCCWQPRAHTQSPGILQLVPRLPAVAGEVALHKFFCLSKDGFGAESVDHESVSGEPESVSGGAEGDFGDNHRSCDIRNDAVLDAMHFIDGIFIVARPG
jgi:hypothetical protein